MKRLFRVIGLLLVSCQFLTAQYDAQLSNHWAAPNYFNPGYAGSTENLDVTLLNRMQWVGLTKRTPKTMMLAGEMPFNFFNRTHGVGLMMLTESAGLFNHSLIAVQYAYKKDLWKGKLSIGFQAGYLNDSFDGGEIEIPESEDHEQPDNDEDLPTGEIEGSSADFGLGIYYSKKNWYAGFSVTHLLSPTVELGEKHIKELPRGYYLMGGYNIQLNNPLLELRSSLLAKSTILMTQADLTLRLVYNKSFYGGLSWRYGYAEIGNSESVIVMLGGKYKNFQAGYAYDFPTSAIRLRSMGSHEIFIKYVIDLGLGKKGKNKHKSIRIL